MITSVKLECTYSFFHPYEEHVVVSSSWEHANTFKQCAENYPKLFAHVEKMRGHDCVPVYQFVIAEDFAICDTVA